MIFKIRSDYKKELNIKIQGTGVGGCDETLQPGQEIDDKCWCLWGTINYSFCAYKTSVNGAEPTNTTNVGSGSCPKRTGEDLVCSDLSSLGNCYNGAYSCSVDVNGFCHCETI